MNEITIGNKTYISSKRAAEITGYAKDYIGQLCREGRVDARLVGRNWYLFEKSIREHRFGPEMTSQHQHKVVIEPSEKPRSAIPSIDALWEAPRYEHDSEDTLLTAPLEQPQSENPLVSSVEEPKEALADMQSAWSEWFATRSQDHGSSSEQSVGSARIPEEIGREAVYEAEVQVPLHIMKSPSAIPQEPVIISAVEEGSRESEEVSEPRGTERSKFASSIAVRAGLVLMGAAFVLMALIGTEVVSIPSTIPAEASVSNFLTGTTAYSK